MQSNPTHHIDLHILKVLTFSESARYRDLRPKNIDSNLFNYHRKVLLQQGYIVQNNDKTYSLGVKGLRLAEKASFDDLRVRERPKLSVQYLINDGNGSLAVWDKAVQPFIGTTNLPNGKVRLEDKSVSSAAKRMLNEVANIKHVKINLCGVADVCVMQGEDVITHTINMVVVAKISPQDVTSELIYWINRTDLGRADLTPGVESIVNDFWQTKQYSYKSYIVNL